MPHNEETALNTPLRVKVKQAFIDYVAGKGPLAELGGSRSRLVTAFMDLPEAAHAKLLFALGSWCMICAEYDVLLSDCKFSYFLIENELAHLRLDEAALTEHMRELLELVSLLYTTGCYYEYEENLQRLCEHKGDLSSVYAVLSELHVNDMLVDEVLANDCFNVILSHDDKPSLIQLVDFIKTQLFDRFDDDSYSDKQAWLTHMPKLLAYDNPSLLYRVLNLVRKNLMPDFQVDLISPDVLLACPPSILQMIEETLQSCPRRVSSVDKQIVMAYYRLSIANEVSPENIQAIKRAFGRFNKYEVALVTERLYEEGLFNERMLAWSLGGEQPRIRVEVAMTVTCANFMGVFNCLWMQCLMRRGCLLVLKW